MEIFQTHRLMSPLDNGTSTAHWGNAEWRYFHINLVLRECAWRYRQRGLIWIIVGWLFLESIHRSSNVDAETLFIEQPIYASVDWKLTSLINLVNFYINSCHVEFGSNTTLRIINHNCYATTFGTKQYQSDNVAQQQALFNLLLVKEPVPWKWSWLAIWK